MTYFMLDGTQNLNSVNQTEFGIILLVFTGVSAVVCLDNEVKHDSQEWVVCVCVSVSAVICC